MLSLTSLPTASRWMTTIVFMLLGNATASTDSTEWCRPKSRSPHDWTCLDADSILPTCCPPGSVCLASTGICEPTPSVSSDPAESTSNDWYAPCFYPNGDIEPKDMPCSSHGGACCPGRWECLSNGLCYNDHTYERHTCTDQAWGSSCPQVCEIQHGSSANASEGVVMCSTNDTHVSGCCTGNIGESDICCDNAYASSFALIGLWSSRYITRRYTLGVGKLFEKLRKDYICPNKQCSTFTTITSNSEDVISTIVSTAFITAAPTSSPGSSIDIQIAPASVGNATNEPTNSRPMPTILGTAIGIPLGLLALIAILIILRRHRNHNTLGGRTPETYFPPDPIYDAATNVLPRVELDAQSQATYELDGQVASTELESSARAVADSKDPSTTIYELDATPSVSPESSDRVSALTTAYEPRFSAVSSLEASPQQYPTAAAAASRLQVVSQQHYGAAQSQFLIPEDMHRLDRPLSGTLPAVQAAESELSMTPSPTGGGEQNRGGEKADEGETTDDVHKSKHVVPRQPHEEAEEVHESAETDKGVINDEATRTEGEDNANEQEQTQAGESG